MAESDESIEQSQLIQQYLQKRTDTSLVDFLRTAQYPLKMISQKAYNKHKGMKIPQSLKRTWSEQQEPTTKALVLSIFDILKEITFFSSSKLTDVQVSNIISQIRENTKLDNKDELQIGRIQVVRYIMNEIKVTGKNSPIITPGVFASRFVIVTYDLIEKHGSCRLFMNTKREVIRSFPNISNNKIEDGLFIVYESTGDKLTFKAQCRYFIECDAQYNVIICHGKLTRQTTFRHSTLKQLAEYDNISIVSHTGIPTSIASTYDIKHVETPIKVILPLKVLYQSDSTIESKYNAFKEGEIKRRFTELTPIQTDLIFIRAYLQGKFDRQQPTIDDIDTSTENILSSVNTLILLKCSDTWRT
jgi:hypothetical protein